MLRALLLTLAAVPGFFYAVADGGAGAEEAPTTAPFGHRQVSFGGQWHGVWDDSTDLALDDTSKTCTIELEVIGGQVVGRFVGPVLNQTRTAIFTGEVIADGRTPLVTLAQREPGYTCTYQLSLVSNGELQGTWRDVNGAAGTIVLRRGTVTRIRPRFTDDLPL